MKKLLIICLVVLTACHSNKPTAPFKILKSTKVKDGVKMDIQVNSRLTKPQMIAIAAKIKSDSSQYNELQLDYLLPGSNYKNTGGISIYATASYHKTPALADTIKDANENWLGFEFIGFAPEKAKKLLALNPADMAGRTLLGKFIDDNTGTISLIYQDKRDENQVYILEMDTVGKVISATAPMAITHNGIKKLVVSEQGDYMTLKDSLLTLYSSDAPEKPFRSIKEGI
jgi:hypothetical protein